MMTRSTIRMVTRSMARSTVLVAPALLAFSLLASCSDTSSTSQSTSQETGAKTGEKAGEKTAEKPATPKTPKAPESVALTGSAVKAVASTAKEAAPAPSAGTEAAKDAAGKAAEALPDLDAVTGDSFTIEKLRKSLPALDTARLTALADKLLAALDKENGVLAGLKDQLGKLGVADLARAGEIKDRIARATKSLLALREKLQAAVDALKSKGADVSKYLAALSGK